MLRTPFDLCKLAAPRVAIPDLEVVVDTRDDDVAAQLRVLQQRGRKADAPLLVELALRCAGEEEALHPAALLAQRVERCQTALDEVIPVLARVREEASVHAAGHDDAAFERLPKAGRQGEPVLVVDRVLMFTEKHRWGGPLLTTFPHDKPRSPTCPPLGRGTRLSVRAAPGQRLGAAAGADADRLFDRLARREPVREAGGEAVAAAVPVPDGAGQRGGTERPARPDPAAEPAGRRDDRARRRVELAVVELLGRVFPTSDEDVELLGR